MIPVANRESASSFTGSDPLLEQARHLYNDEYKRHFFKGETKPRSIGEPFLLHNPESTKGILLIHGLMAAPEEVRQWAEYLFSIGYTVHAPRLAGHGTSAVDLSTKQFDDWVASVDSGHNLLKQYCSSIVIGGFSTGAGLALYQAIRKPGAFDAVLSVSAPLKFKGFAVNAVEALHAWNWFAGRIGKKKLQKKYVRNHPDNPDINYHRCPVQGIVEVRSLMRHVYKSIHRLFVPVLIVQGQHDPKVDGRSGLKLFRRAPHPDNSYSEIDYHQHGIVRGKIARKVFNDVKSFLMSIHSE